MENVKLDNKVKQALDLFDLRKIEIRTEPSNTYDSCNGLLHQVGSLCKLVVDVTNFSLCRDKPSFWMLTLFNEVAILV